MPPKRIHQKPKQELRIPNNPNASVVKLANPLVSGALLELPDNFMTLNMDNVTHVNLNEGARDKWKPSSSGALLRPPGVSSVVAVLSSKSSSFELARVSWVHKMVALSNAAHADDMFANFADRYNVKIAELRVAFRAVGRLLSSEASNREVFFDELLIHQLFGSEKAIDLSTYIRPVRTSVDVEVKAADAVVNEDDWNERPSRIIDIGGLDHAYRFGRIGSFELAYLFTGNPETGNGGKWTAVHCAVVTASDQTATFLGGSLIAYIRADGIKDELEGAIATSRSPPVVVFGERIRGANCLIENVNATFVTSFYPNLVVIIASGFKKYVPAYGAPNHMFGKEQRIAARALTPSFQREGANTGSYGKIVADPTIRDPFYPRSLFFDIKALFYAFSRLRLGKSVGSHTNTANAVLLRRDAYDRACFKTLKILTSVSTLSLAARKQRDAPADAPIKSFGPPAQWGDDDYDELYGNKEYGLNHTHVRENLKALVGCWSDGPVLRSTFEIQTATRMCLCASMCFRVIYESGMYPDGFMTNFRECLSEQELFTLFKNALEDDGSQLWKQTLQLAAARHITDQ